mmetsp:Transcript_3970/g.7865  ORF Transcript_3970/g.7865 Transcript_3970/m.7865 type:complete len:684 (-) Transcript_3970:207-2258(-)
MHSPLPLSFTPSTSMSVTSSDDMNQSGNSMVEQQSLSIQPSNCAYIAKEPPSLSKGSDCDQESPCSSPPPEVLSLSLPSSYHSPHKPPRNNSHKSTSPPPPAKPPADAPKSKLSRPGSLQLVRYTPPKSPTAPKQLSPQAYRSAKTSDQTAIQRLRLECHSLSLALKSFKKHSSEWNLINNRLELAEEELEAMLLDRDLFLFGEAGSAAVKPDDGNDFLVGIAKINPKSGSDRDDVKESKMEGENNPQKQCLQASSKSRQTEKSSLQNKLESVPKFSLEYFQIRMELSKLEQASGGKEAGVPGNVESSNETDSNDNEERSATIPCSGSDSTKPKTLVPALPSTSDSGICDYHVDKGKENNGAIAVMPSGTPHSYRDLNPNRTSEVIESNHANKTIENKKIPPLEGKSMQQLQGQLNSLQKYTLEWFEVKRAIAELQAEKELQKTKNEEEVKKVVRSVVSRSYQRSKSHSQMLTKSQSFFLPRMHTSSRPDVQKKSSETDKKSSIGAGGSRKERSPSMKAPKMKRRNTENIRSVPIEITSLGNIGEITVQSNINNIGNNMIRDRNMRRAHPYYPTPTPPTSPEDSASSPGGESVEEKFHALRKKLNKTHKYSREWFEIKKQIFIELHKGGLLYTDVFGNDGAVWNVNTVSTNEHIQNSSRGDFALKGGHSRPLQLPPTLDDIDD